MRNRQKTFVSWVMIFALIISSCAAVTALDIVNEDSFMDILLQEGEHDTEHFFETQRQMIAQAPAVDALNVLMNEFFTDVTGYWTLVYPDIYAGSFLDNDILVIQLTDISDEATAFYRYLLDSIAPITFRQVEFSINELTAFGDIFAETLDTALIVGRGFDALYNKYRIYLDSTQFAGDRTVAGFLPDLPISIGFRGSFEHFFDLP